VKCAHQKSVQNTFSRAVPGASSVMILTSLGLHQCSDLADDPPPASYTNYDMFGGRAPNALVESRRRCAAVRINVLLPDSPLFHPRVSISHTISRLFSILKLFFVLLSISLVYACHTYRLPSPRSVELTSLSIVLFFYHLIIIVYLIR
jgi:hypothetical protein